MLIKRASESVIFVSTETVPENPVPFRFCSFELSLVLQMVAGVEWLLDRVRNALTRGGY